MIKSVYIAQKCLLDNREKAPVIMPQERLNTLKSPHKNFKSVMRQANKTLKRSQLNSLRKAS